MNPGVPCTESLPGGQEVLLVHISQWGAHYFLVSPTHTFTAKDWETQ